MKILLVLFIFGLILGCSGQIPRELVAEGDRPKTIGNIRGAIVLYENALAKDANELSPRAESLTLQDRNHGVSDALTIAEHLFNGTIILNPSSASAYLNLVKTYLQRSDLSRAELRLCETIALDGRRFEDIHMAQAKIALVDKKAAPKLPLYTRDRTLSEDAVTARRILNQLL